MQPQEIDGTSWIDDVGHSPAGSLVPEPASLSLLATAAVLLLRRRRRTRATPDHHPPCGSDAARVE